MMEQRSKNIGKVAMYIS